MTTALILVPALLLDALLGEPERLWTRVPHPAVLLGRAVAALERALNRGAARRLRGAFALAVLVAAAGGTGWALALLGPWAEALGAAILIAQRSLCDHVGAVATALERDIPSARRAVAMIVGRDTDAMDAPEIARAAIESGAENFSDGVIAPAFWFLVAGLPGIAIYKAVNTADSMIGHRTEALERFGWASARLDDALNLVPARLTAFLVALVSGQLARLPDIAADARRHRSPNAGWPEAALARALGLALAGPRSYGGQRAEIPFVNAAGRRDAGAADIRAAVALLWRNWAVFLGFTILLACALSLAPA